MLSTASPISPSDIYYPGLLSVICQRSHTSSARGSSLLPRAGGFADENIIFYQLAIIFVRRNHIYLVTLCGGLPGNGADNIVRFVTVHFQHGNIEPFDDAFDIGEVRPAGLPARLHG